MKKRKMAVTDLDKPITEMVNRTDHRKLAIWAADCAERALPYFEQKFPEDDRPRKAIEACRAWASTGIFEMSHVRRMALAAHAAAREAKEDGAARSAARAAGQAMATAHVPGHCIAAAVYSATAVRDATGSKDADAPILREREWQYARLIELAGKHEKRGLGARSHVSRCKDPNG